MPPTLYIGLVASVVALGAPPALARSPGIFINGVRVDGLSNQRLAGVDVFFDEAGDVQITARGYKVKASEPDADQPPAAAPPATPPAATAPPAATPSPGKTTAPAARHFFIAAVAPRGRPPVGWDIDVFINQVFVRKFRSNAPDPLVDISRFLKAGPNVVHFTATRDPAARGTGSPADYFELVLGDGELRDGEVVLNQISAYRRTAGEAGTFNSETTVNLATAPSL